ncbi:MarR family transcriptional regulator [Actinomadura sp. 6K520]|jgi:DNA-binding MarR family transcriptional regulator|uniref:MarR family winged helix-turn-helix transcriptional regulator n=1 Tax=Actinomadura sp. 6K520 TaxID=2530364 RepID=UPI001042B2C3|nr:MarR family transcriptional regulator [Actinomadura sp. 6K520]TDE35010.1 MarR family transcriptional regulator [Actinomadura sp. 6K520]
MTEPRWLDADEQETWRAFLWTSRLLNEALDRQLQRDSGMPHAYYMILAMLSESPGRALTMSELAEVVHSSPSRLSHAVNRLEEAGWVRRTKHATDRRATIAQLTDAGFAALAEAAPGHVAEVRRRLFDPLTRERMLEFRETLHALLEGLDPDHTAPCAPDPG